MPQVIVFLISNIELPVVFTHTISAYYDIKIKRTSI